MERSDVIVEGGIVNFYSRTSSNRFSIRIYYQNSRMLPSFFPKISSERLGPVIGNGIICLQIFKASSDWRNTILFRSDFEIKNGNGNYIRKKTTRNFCTEVIRYFKNPQNHFGERNNGIIISSFPTDLIKEKEVRRTEVKEQWYDLDQLESSNRPI